MEAFCANISMPFTPSINCLISIYLPPLCPQLVVGVTESASAAKVLEEQERARREAVEGAKVGGAGSGG